MSKSFQREQKSNEPILAICYDFDKTLSPEDMQAQGFIQDAYGDDIGRFWAETDELSSKNDMDSNLAYMLKMKNTTRGKMIFNRATLTEYGEKVALFPGVDTWFDRVNRIGEQNGVRVEHYIISSGLKEMIEATKPARDNAFKKIYASSFYYDEYGEAVWPAQAVNFTNKTQFLFRISKGVLDVNDPDVNTFFKPDELRVPFENMIYIGDSATDIPCMKLVNTNGGHSIAVYNPETGDKSRVYQMMQQNRIRYFVPADYTEGSAIEKLVEKIIRNTSVKNELDREHYDCQRETEEYAVKALLEKHKNDI